MTELVGPRALDAGIVRILDGNGAPVGLGFLVTDVLAITCAHVVMAALGSADGEVPAGDRVQVDLPLLRETAAQGPMPAAVEQWFPATRHTGDVAVLRLGAAIPGGRPVRMAVPQDAWEHGVRMFGFPEGRPGGVWHSGVLRGRQADGWLQADLAVETGYQVSAGFSGGPVWDETLEGVIGMVVAAEVRAPPSSYLIPTDDMFALWPELRDLTVPPSPFRGLTAFREADAAVFYGRRRESDELADLVMANPRVCVVGPSGSGKSSLAMAGVAPRLRERGFAVAAFRPGTGSSPLAALAAALLPLLEPGLSAVGRISRIGDLVAVMSNGGLADVVADVGGRLLIIVDQVEELLVLEDSAIDEMAVILFGAHLPESVRLLTTLRADFLDRALDEPRLRNAVEGTLFALGPMSPEQLKEIVTGPVAAVPGVAYAEGVADRILEDAGASPGVLPLVAFTLDLLWQRQSEGYLTLAAYDGLGRVAGALSAHADRIWSEYVVEEDEPTARRLFTRLIRLPSGAQDATRVTVPQADLSADELRIAQRLTATRLLVTGRNSDGAKTVELAHETLIGQWSRLRTWTEQDRAFLVWRESLRQDLERWEREARSPERLPTAMTLAEAERWLAERADELTQAERDYLEAGRAQLRARTRRRRTLFFGLGTIVMVAAVLASLLVYQRHVSAVDAASSNSRALAENSADEAESDPARSVMLALAAYRTAHTQEARNALLRSYITYSSDARVLSGLLGQLGPFQASQDGNVVVARSGQGRAMLYVHAAAGPIRSEALPSNNQVVYPLAAPDGRRVGYVDAGGSVEWFDVVGHGGRLIGPPHVLRSAGPVSGTALQQGAVMSVDGRLIATETSNRIVWWDTGTGTIGGTLPVPRDANGSIWFGSAGGPLLAGVFTRSSLSGLVSVNRSTGAVRVLTTNADQLAVSGDGSTVVACRGRAGHVVVMAQRVTDGAVRGQPYTQQSDTYCPDLSVDLSGTRAAMLNGDSATLINLDNGTQISPVTVPSGTFIAYPDLVSTGGTLYLLGSVTNAITYTALPTGPRHLQVSQAELTPDGHRVISVSKDGSAIQSRAALGGGQVLAAASRLSPFWPLSQTDQIRENNDGTLLADREARNVVVVRAAGTLREITRVTTIMPPPAQDGLDGFTCFFDAAGRLVTFSGPLIQLWDPRTGRQVAHFNVAMFHPAAGSDPSLSPFPKGDQVAVAVKGNPSIHIIDLTSGRITKDVRTGSDSIAIRFDPSGRYFALLRTGSILELWRLEPLRKEIGPLPSVADTSDPSFAAEFVGTDGRYLLAANNTVRIYQVGSRSIVDSYDLGGGTSDNTTPYTFVSVSANGKTLLYANTDSTEGGILPLDPGLWTHQLCDIIGDRQFTTADRDQVPVKVPATPTCPIAPR